MIDYVVTMKAIFINDYSFFVARKLFSIFPEGSYSPDSIQDGLVSDLNGAVSWGDAGATLISAEQANQTIREQT